MKKKFITTIALVCCFIVCFAFVADITGKWSGSLTTPDGQELPVTYTFKVDGEKLTGNAESPAGNVTIDNGKIKGDDFSFTVTVQGTDYPHTGKVYADSLSLNVDFGSSKAHTTLKKAK